MAATLSTLGEMQEMTHSVETPQQQQEVNVEAANGGIAALENEKLQEQQAVPQSENQPAAEQQSATQEEDNSSTFEINLGGEQQSLPEVDNQASQQQQQAAPTAVFNWQEEIKKVDPKEVAKAAGISDFAFELNQHILNGGSAMDYLNARAIDYTKINEVDLIKSDLRSQFPNASEEQLNLYIEKKYSQGELAEEDDKQFGAMNMQADANRIRQQKIAEQAKFKIAEPVQVQATQSQEQIQAQQAAVLQAQQEAEREMKYFETHEATKDLLTSKRVAVDLGEGLSYNFKLNNPDALLKVMTDNETYRRAITNEKGEPNVRLLQRLALVALNPNYEKDLVNYGKALGKKSLVEEGQNAQRPNGQPAGNQPVKGVVIKGMTTVGA